MLYKKYHRNFVRKFKKGTRFAVISVETVMKEPWCDNKEIYVGGSKYGRWNLVYPGGEIDKYIRVDDAV